MRHLIRKQRKLLMEWVNDNKEKVGIGFNIEYHDFPYDLYEELQEINDYETLVQDINRFVSDLAVSNDV